MKKRADIFREERLRLIIEQLMNNKKVMVLDLAHEFNVSPSSIRLDLAELEKRGLLTRTYGGGMLPETLDQPIIVRKSILEARQEALKEEKEAIGCAAAEFVEDGDTLMLDGGSTMAYFARHLKNKRHLTVVTIALNLLPLLQEIDGIDIYVAGGLLLPRYDVLSGEIALDVLGRFHTAKCFMGMDGISINFGLTSTDYSIAAMKRKMLTASRQLIVLCDHTKLDQVSLLPVAPVDKMDVLVTDHGASETFVASVRERGPQVVIA